MDTYKIKGEDHYQCREVKAERDRLQAQNRKLNALHDNMRADVRQYLMPEKTQCSKDWLVSRLIFRLEMSETKEAQESA